MWGGVLGVEILTRMSCFLIKFNEKAWKKGYKGPMTKDNDGSISIALEKATETKKKVENRKESQILHSTFLHPSILTLSTHHGQIGIGSYYVRKLMAANS